MAVRTKRSEEDRVVLSDVSVVYNTTKGQNEILVKRSGRPGTH